MHSTAARVHAYSQQMCICYYSIQKRIPQFSIDMTNHILQVHLHCTRMLYDYIPLVIPNYSLAIWEGRETNVQCTRFPQTHLNKPLHHDVLTSAVVTSTCTM